MLLSGIFPPITTPFYPDGEVYYKKIEANVERYSRTPVSGIVVLGSTGEAILLSDQEHRDALKAALGAAAPNKVMIAGTGIEVFEVIGAWKAAKGDWTALRQAFDFLSEGQLQAALHYYREYPAEVDARLAEEDEAHLERFWKEHPWSKPPWR